jgi:hypothetical protein
LQQWDKKNKTVQVEKAKVIVFLSGGNQPGDLTQLGS